MDNFPELGIVGTFILKVVILLGRFITKYFDKKAEDFATKRSMMELTEKVENIKTTNAKTLALVNTNLSLTSKGIESFEGETMKAKVEYHNACSYIMNDVGNIDLTTLNIANIDLLDGYGKVVFDSFKRIRMAKANHDLFVDAGDIKDTAHAFFYEVISYVGNVNRMISSLSYELKAQKDNKKAQWDNVSRPGSEVNELLAAWYDTQDKEHNEAISKLRGMIHEVTSGKNEHKAIEHLVKYQSLIRLYLRHEKRKQLQETNER